MKLKTLLISLFLTVGLYAVDLNNLPAYSTTYDIKADPYLDLQLAMNKVEKSDKKILLIVGGDWCKWCGTFDNLIDDNIELSNIFYNTFEVVKVYYGRDISKKTKSFLKQFPVLKGTPHFYILDKNAKLLKSIDTSYLERGYGYNKKEMMKFIKQNK